MFLKLKQESSGYLAWVQSEEDEDRYIEEYHQDKGIVLDKAAIAKNPGQKDLTEFNLNSMWGKCAQNSNKTQTTPVKRERQFYEFLCSPGTEVTNLIFPNNNVAWLSWRYTKEDMTI
jgi:hypothetical protein